MSKCKKITFTCPKCGKKFKTTIYESVNVQLNPELKEKVLSGEIYAHKCPKCGYEDHYFNPMVYHDMDKKTMIIGDTTDSVMWQMENLKNPTKEFAGLLPNQTYIGVCHPYDIASGISAMDAGMDYRICFIIAQSVTAINIDMWEDQDPMKAFENVVTMLNYEDGKLYIDIRTEYGNNRTELTQEMYDKVKEEMIARIAKTNAVIFDPESITQYMSYDMGDDAQHQHANIIYVSDDNGRIHMCLANDLIEKELNIGTNVIVEINNSDLLCTVEKIVDYDMDAFPVRFNNLPVIDHICDGIDLETEDLGYEKLDGHKLMEHLVQKRGIMHYEPNEIQMLKDTYFAVPIKRLAEPGEHGVLAEPIIFHEENGDYLAVVLRKEDLYDNKTTYVVSTFDNVVRLLLDQPRLKGLTIVNNLGEDLDLTRNYLKDYRHQKLMAGDANMSKFLKTLTKDEREFVGLENLKLIEEVYFGKIAAFDAICEKLGYTTEEGSKIIDGGYEQLRQLAEYRFHKYQPCMDC